VQAVRNATLVTIMIFFRGEFIFPHS